uniref:Leucine-rich repeat-containing protein 27 n=1 Tax=Phallusia mammillata TaxID=59560 RepID=A0A6F9DKS6_9ASCI|nr:leucine-rich repeat-containing protein 27 [Phallusia mammillata]
MKNNHEAVKIITQQSPDNPYMDLAKKSITSVPEEIFMLPHIQHLYLEENLIKQLPDNFFDHLPNLQWLDLRNNQLTCIPVSIGRHQSIKNLLLEGNALTHLPLQMGMTKCLTGLNLRGNPLQMPPQHIVDQGVYVILSYLYQELQNRTKEPPLVHEQVEKLSLVNEEDSVSEDDVVDEGTNQEDRDIPSPMSDDFDLLRHALTPTTATLHKPTTYQDMRVKQNSLLDGLRNKSRRGKELSLLELREQEDQRKDQLRSLKERQVAHADQRRKDAVVLENWRKETKRLQRQFQRSTTDINLKPAPYGTDLQHHSELREERVERVLPSEGSNRKEFAIQQKKRQYSSDVHQRMRKLRDDEMLMSMNRQEKQEQSKELQQQLLEAKMSKDAELEYRFRAFTGDTASVQSSSNKTGSM